MDAQGAHFSCYGDAYFEEKKEGVKHSTPPRISFISSGLAGEIESFCLHHSRLMLP